MRKRKILPTIFVAVAAMLAIAVAPIFAQADANNITASIADAKDYYDAGDELTLNVALSSFPADYDTVQIRLSYDSSKLQYVSASEYNGAMVMTSGNQIAINRGATGSVLTAGDLAGLKFSVLSSVSGSAAFDFFSVEFDNTSDDNAPTVNGTYDDDITVQFSTPLSSISLSADKTAIGVGEIANLTVVYNPSDTTDDKTVTFSSSDNDIATVSSAGVVTGVELGSAVITAHSNVTGVADATITINITADLTGIAVSPSTAEIKPGETKNLSIEYTPANATDKGTISWSSSDDTVATVDGNGAVTGVGFGTATITAANSLTGIADATATVTVARHVEAVTIKNGANSLAAGETIELNRASTLTLSAEYSPASVSDDTTVTWTSTDESVATVSSAGVVTPVAGNKGTTTITASIAGKSTSVKVKVVVPVEGISLPADFSLEPGAEQVIVATFTPTDADNQNVVWESSDTSVITVDNGTVKAMAPGTATVTAKSAEDNTITDAVVVTVPDINVTTVTIDKQDQTIVKGTELQLAATYAPTNATNAGTTAWASSDTSVATVDAGGKVTAVAGGTATITATIAGVSGTTTVKVVVPLESINFSASEVNINKGNNATVGVNILPVDTTDNNAVVYASQSPEIATVDMNTGVITAVKTGDAVITATKGDKIAYLTVHVRSPLTSISIDTAAELIKGQSKALTITYNPADTTDSKEIAYENSDNTVVKVENTEIGVIKLTALKEGTSTLTVRSSVAGVAEKTIDITVTEIHLTGIAINNTIDMMLKGTERQLAVVFTPENTTDETEIKWTSSDTSVAKISNDGVVKALRAGEATITAKVGTLVDSFDITVEEVPLTAITMELSKDTVSVGSKAYALVTAVPENTTDEYIITYSSSDENVATVDGDGVIKGINAGTAVITAVTSTGLKAQAVVTVEAVLVAPDTGIMTREQSAVMATSFGLAGIAVALRAALRRHGRAKRNGRFSNWTNRAE